MITSLSDTGKAVDWTFWYKTPKLGDEADGYGYAYFDSDIDASAGKVQLSPFSLAKEEGAFRRTFAQCQNPEAGFILWNDERPDGRKDVSGFGHTKGFIIADDKTGCYQLHSWPLTPLRGLYKPPTPIYGQTALCLSLSVDTLDKIAAQMLSHQEPQIYDSKEIASWGRNLRSLAAGTLVPKPLPSFDVFDGETLGGVPFKILAENRQNLGNFWEEIANAIGVQINTETWIRGPISPVMEPGGVYRVFDVKAISLHPLGIPLAWGETFDHAKWGLSDDPTKPWVFIADKNRQLSQAKRGGGCIAIQNIRLWTALSQTDLIVPPPGKTGTEALAHIKKTHS